MGEVDDIIRKKDDELKYFKLELINRENSYNKIFKNNVLVGNINPMDYKTSFKPNGAPNSKDASKPMPKPNGNLITKNITNMSNSRVK